MAIGTILHFAAAETAALFPEFTELTRVTIPFIIILIKAVNGERIKTAGQRMNWFLEITPRCFGIISKTARDITVGKRATDIGTISTMVGCMMMFI